MKFKLAAVNVGLLIMVLLHLGCRSGPQTVATKQAIATAKSLKEPVTPAEASDIQRRSEMVLGLARQMDANHKAFSKRVKKLSGDAEAYGWTHFSVGAGGLAAGIAAAALVVASPANAVWIAALSGLSGGAAAFNGAFDTQGFSKAGIANGLGPIIAQEAAAYTNFVTGKLLDYAFDRSKASEWQAEYEIQNQRVRLVESATLRLHAPIVPSSAELKELQDKIDQQTRELQNLARKVDAKQTNAPAGGSH